MMPMESTESQTSSKQIHSIQTHSQPSIAEKLLITFTRFLSFNKIKTEYMEDANTRKKLHKCLKYVHPKHVNLAFFEFYKKKLSALQDSILRFKQLDKTQTNSKSITTNYQQQKMEKLKKIKKNIEIDIKEQTYKNELLKTINTLENVLEKLIINTPKLRANKTLKVPKKLSLGRANSYSNLENNAFENYKNELKNIETNILNILKKENNNSEQQMTLLEYRKKFNQLTSLIQKTINEPKYITKLSAIISNIKKLLGLNITSDVTFIVQRTFSGSNLKTSENK